MDLREASAMTEASGLTDDPAAGEGASWATGVRGERSPANGASPQAAAARLAGQLREITTAAPLRSLLMAFVLGVWVARRR